MVTITDREFTDLTEFIKSRFGIRLGQEKKTLVLGRLSNMLVKEQFSSFSEYLEHLLNDKTGRASATLVNLITTNHTFFMRETAHFDFFRSTVLPFLASHVKDKDLRIWSAGCSSGEESYTLAMIIDTFFGPDKRLWDTKLLATDISDKVLSIAREGIYSNEALAALPGAWRANYTRRLENERSMMTDFIKNDIIFRRLNLMDERFPFRKKFHVIFCRNVMIYFDAKTRKQLVEKFYDLTAEGGYLFIGQSESISRDDSRWKYVLPAIYRKGR